MLNLHRDKKIIVFFGLATNTLNVRNNMEAVDLTSYVGTISTWLASDILA